MNRENHSGRNERQSLTNCRNCVTNFFHNNVQREQQYDDLNATISSSLNKLDMIPSSLQYCTAYGISSVSKFRNVIM